MWSLQVNGRVYAFCIDGTIVGKFTEKEGKDVSCVLNASS
jgi:hypothetical protein